MSYVVVLVTDPRYGLEHTIRVIRAAGEALGPGSNLLVQLRDKESSEGELVATGRALRAATREVGAALVINGSVAVAREVAADGVHLPSSAEALGPRIAAARAVLGERALVTTAAHDDDGVRAASEGGATSVMVSPIFATPGKGPARGVAALVSARAIVDASRRTLGVVALGGVTPENAGACRAAGADAVAAIRALYEAASEAAVRDAVLALAREPRS